VKKLGGTAVQGDVHAIDDVTRHANGADVVIHAITAIPSGFDVRRASAWEANDRARVEDTRTLSEVAARVGASVYLQQSVAWVVKRAVGDPAYDEATSPNPPRLLASALEGERIARAAGTQHGFAVGVLRGGAFYGADTAQSQSFAADLRARRLPNIGDGQTLVAPIHVDDMAAAFVLAAHSRQDGLWHVVDDAPLPFATLLRLFASAIGAPAPRRVPTWLARMLIGSDAIEAITTSMRTSNARIRRELGWSPRYAAFEEGVDAMVHEWRGAGTSLGR
jgi:nucleoside-diphosphate-sugar epimerase